MFGKLPVRLIILSSMLSLAPKAYGDRNELTSYLSGGGRETFSALVMHKGETLYQLPTDGSRSQRKYVAWSLAKAVVNALVEAHIQKGLIPNIDVTLGNIGMSDVRLAHALGMSTCRRWKEVYDDNIIQSDPIAMLYGEGYQDTASYVTERPKLRGCKPGEDWKYSSGNSNLVMAYLKALRPSGYDNMPWDFLFNPLRMSQTTLERDLSGTFVGSSFLFSTARDMASLGMLYLDGGRVGDQQVFSKEWAELAGNKTPTKA
ncbi:MAG: serine hydrolase [Pseudobacteriovorax sp.]|nr:serine hydrolase [Pseudobacteriovorax sp.]